MRAMVLAAGRGSRLAPLTDECPKPLLEVGGITLLERTLRGLETAGFERIVLNVSWLGEQIRSAVRARPAGGAEVVISDEGELRLETGGGIYRALSLLGRRPFAVVNSDVLTDFPMARLADQIERWPATRLAHCVLVPNPPHNAGGDFSCDPDGHLHNEPRLTFSGLSVLHPLLFDSWVHGNVYPLAPLLRGAADEGRASAEVWHGYWNDVGTRKRLMEARRVAGSTQLAHPAGPGD